MGAIQFIENLDRTALTVSDNEFEREVEHAVSSIAERNQQPRHQPNEPTYHTSTMQISEKSTLSQPQVNSQNLIAIEPQKSQFRDKPQIPHLQNNTEDDTAVDGLLRTIKRPLSSLGRMFTDEGTALNSAHHNLAPPPQPARRLSPDVFLPPRHSEENEQTARPTVQAPVQASAPSREFNAADAAARQASAEAAQAHRIQQAEHQNVVE